MTGQSATSDCPRIRVRSRECLELLGGALRRARFTPAITALPFIRRLYSDRRARSSQETATGHKSSVRNALCSATSRRCLASLSSERGILHHLRRNRPRFGPRVFTRAG